MTTGGLQRLRRPSAMLSDIRAMTPTHVNNDPIHRQKYDKKQERTEVQEPSNGTKTVSW